MDNLARFKKAWDNDMGVIGCLIKKYAKSVKLLDIVAKWSLKEQTNLFGQWTFNICPTIIVPKHVDLI